MSEEFLVIINSKHFLLGSAQDFCHFSKKFLSHKKYNQFMFAMVVPFMRSPYYSKTCVKWPLKNRQYKGLNDKW